MTTSSYQEADDLSEINQNQSHFLSAIKQGAMDGAKEGVLPSITAAQAILESGWGSSELAKAPNNNLFGIKDSEDWNGEIVTVLPRNMLMVTISRSMQLFENIPHGMIA